MSETRRFPYGSMVEAFADHAAKTPDKVFVVDGKKQFTYEEGLKIACGYAEYLKEQGVKEGDCVIVKVSQTSAPYFCDLAVQLLHAVYVPVEKVVAAERVNFIIEKTGAKIFISDKDLGVNAKTLLLKEIFDHAAASIPENLSFPEPEATGEILFTTGTTGTSKGVEMSNVATVHVAENVVNAVGMTPDDAEIIPIPINHAMGLRRSYANMLTGSKIIVLDGVVFIDRIWKAFEEHGATGMALVPAMLQMIFKLSGDKIGNYKDRLGYIQIGASVLSHDDKQRLCDLLPNTRLYDFYGCSEAGCACTADFNTRRDKFKSLGIPTCNSKFRIIKEDGEIVEYPTPNVEGRLAYGGSMMMKGYYKEPELSAETIKDGYVVTNDLAHFDDEGFVYLLGRIDDVINCAGTKIAPTEVEEIVIKCPGIADCAVIGVPDQVSGEAVKLFVVMEEGASFDPVAINDFLMDKLEAYKTPKIIVQLDSIPKTYNGKILRRKLKEM